MQHDKANLVLQIYISFDFCWWQTSSFEFFHYLSHPVGAIGKPRRNYFAVDVRATKLMFVANAW